jgi:hypothetical protein
MDIKKKYLLRRTGATGRQNIWGNETSLRGVIVESRKQARVNEDGWENE